MVTRRSPGSGLAAARSRLGERLTRLAARVGGGEMEEGRTAAALEVLPSHVAVVDREGTITSVNQAWCVFARENDLALPRAGLGASYLTVCDLASGEGEAEARQAAAGLRAVLAGRAGFELEYPCHAPTERRWFVVRARRFEHRGEVFAAIAHENITSPREAELQMAAARAAAEAANRTKDQFLAVLSHELRTPLTPALLRAALLLRDPALDPGVRDGLQMIQRNVELEARLVEDLLDLTRVARNKLELQLTTVDAHQHLQATLEIFQREIEAKDLHVSFHAGARRHHVRADPARLQQVFWNVIGNAVKYTPRQGAIRVRTSQGPGERLWIEVSDTGIGIEPDVLPRLFAAFEQGERTLVRRFGGLGLGLTISKALVDRLGGRIAAASPGRDRGATFTIELPTVTPPLELVPPREARHDEGRRPRRVLLVEDNADTLGLLAEQLRDAGHQVMTATSVAGALEVAGDTPCDVLVADIGLPDGTGWDLLRALRERGPITGIAVSGFASDEDVARSLSAGFAEHLPKPVLPETLEAALRRTS